MLEKIGLPAKPSLRANNWVVDASHCQGCASQFSLFVRKHHCRRCGGIFCNHCTAQRMFLRGQGDSPVRICDPCKSLEDAARFELRHGSRSRTGKGVVKPGPTSNEPLLQDAEGGGRVSELTIAATNDLQESSPEDLRQQAIEEKKTYKTLKAEGKSAEALKAFKRSKELERQAAALEIVRRKNQRSGMEAASSSSISSNDYGSNGMLNDLVEIASVSGKNKKGKTDFDDELRGLGWSEGDLREADKKSDKLSLEGELFHLVKDAPEEDLSSGSGKSAANNAQVVALKKNAVRLKKEGKLAEAKEELKKAKTLQKELEEMSILGEIEDPDDELSALMLEVNNDKSTSPDIFATNKQDNNFDLSRLMDKANDLVFSDDFEVTDVDINDRDMISTLTSFGWDEEVDNSAVTGIVKPITSNTMNGGNEIPKLPPKSKTAIQHELLSLKRNALALRRQGRVDEAEEELKKGKMLEMQLKEEENVVKPGRLNNKMEYKQESNMLQEIEEEAEMDVTIQDMQDPALLALLGDLGWKDEESQADNSSEKVTSLRVGPVPKSSITTSGKKRKSKAEIQRELLGIKRAARSLRQEGKHEEAEEQLRVAKELEIQLSEMDQSSTKDVSSLIDTGDKMVFSVINDLQDPKVNVSDQDMKDPEFSEALRGLGWKEIEGTKHSPVLQSEAIKSNVPDESKGQMNIGAASKVDVSHQLIKSEAVNNLSQGKKSSNQKEYSSEEIIKAHKLKALAFKREGKIAEAREELRQAKLLEKSLTDENAEMVERKQSPVSASVPAAASPVEQVQPSTKSSPLSSRERFKLQQQCLALKRQARKLQMEGKVEEAMSELESAKAIERQLEEAAATSAGSASKKVELDDANVEDFLDPQLLSALTAIGLHGIATSATPSTSLPSPASIPILRVSAPAPAPVHLDKQSGSLKHELEEQIKMEKKKAVTLKQAGKREEALNALRRAKQLEKQLGESQAS